MKKKIIMTSVVVWVLFLFMDCLLHGFLLKGLYEQTATLWRPMEEMRRFMWIFWAADALMAFLLVWIFFKGWEAEKAWLGQGLRFGFVIGFFLSVPMGFCMYAMMPMPFSLALGWFAGVLVEFLIASLVAAWMFRET